MWFIRLVKMRNPPSKQTADWINQKQAEAEKWGVKFHQSFVTLGRYDVVVIFEAPDEKAAMRYAASVAPESGGETLAALSREEFDSWYK
jgi:uncharacterized protein with GYD domain